MFIYRKYFIRSFEKGLLFINNEFQRLIDPGTYRKFAWRTKDRIEIVSLREPFFEHAQLDVIVATGALEGHAEVLDLADHERALVWVDGRFDRILAPGLHAIWNTRRKITVERIDIRGLVFEHRQRDQIVGVGGVTRFQVADIDEGFIGLLMLDGKLERELGPGRYTLWKTGQRMEIKQVDLRSRVLDITGQDIMTADRVTLRLNLVLAYRVADAKLAVLGSESYDQALYRQAQLALRAAVGGRTLDQVLTDKEALGKELRAEIVEEAAKVGVRLEQVGVRDIILPGEMKALLNRVTEAKAAAEANLIARREETAAMRSQVNTARLLAENPTLMRMHELEVLKTVTANGKLEVILGEQGLTDRITKLI